MTKNFSARTHVAYERNQITYGHLKRNHAKLVECLKDQSKLGNLLTIMCVNDIGSFVDNMYAAFEYLAEDYANGVISENYFLENLRWYKEVIEGGLKIRLHDVYIRKNYQAIISTIAKYLPAD